MNKEDMIQKLGILAISDAYGVVEILRNNIPQANSVSMMCGHYREAIEILEGQPFSSSYKNKKKISIS